MNFKLVPGLSPPQREKPLGVLGTRLFEFGAFEKRPPGRSRPLIATSYATENKAIRTLFSENNVVELFYWLIGHQIGVIQIAEWSDYDSA